ncbi:hypothetical protein [Inquilinus sp. OTU3971]|uniref:hypothetical protein n=1 Tax=Inquilinus sp. OTU3971 TaxID=3043855 RepID=UPI00313B09C8
MAGPAGDLDRRFRRQRRVILIAGLCLSAVWATMGVWVFARFGFAEDGPHLNDIGDFLAGMFAPLAFIWLVVGYFLQGAELALNTRALALQVQEMQESVRQQSQQAAAMVRSEAHSRRDVVMRVIDFHLDLLSSYACDLWRLASDVGPDTPTVVWDRYSKGDRDVFFVNLAGVLRGVERERILAAAARHLSRGERRSAPAQRRMHPDLRRLRRRVGASGRDRRAARHLRRR